MNKNEHSAVQRELQLEVSVQEPERVLEHAHPVATVVAARAELSGPGEREGY